MFDVSYLTQRCLVFPQSHTLLKYKEELVLHGDSQSNIHFVSLLLSPLLYTLISEEAFLHVTVDMQSKKQKTFNMAEILQKDG